MTTSTNCELYGGPGPAALADGLGSSGRVAEGLATIDEAFARCELTEERWSMAELLRVKGELLLRQDAPNADAAAEDHLRQALDWARRQDALSWELRAATSLARLWHEQRRTSQARRSWRPSTAGSQKGSRPPICSPRKLFSLRFV